MENSTYQFRIAIKKTCPKNGAGFDSKRKK